MPTNIGIQTTIPAVVAPGGTFSVPYPATMAQAQFDANGTASLSIYNAEHTGLAVTFGANAATITWPASASFSLPAGADVFVGLPVPSTPKADAMPAQADSTATTVAGVVTDLNALLAKLRNSGRMNS